MNTRASVRIGVIGDVAVNAGGGLLGAAHLAALIQALAAQAALAGLVPIGRAGDAIRARLVGLGIDVSRIEAAPNPVLKMGDRIDVAELFAMDAVLIAVSDIRLHRFLVDLPVHTAPNARLIGLVDRLAHESNADARETVLRHDAIVATSADLKTLMGVDEDDMALDAIQQAMIGQNLRAAAVRFPNGDARVLTKSDRVRGSAKAFDRFAAATSVVFARRRPWADVFNLMEST